MKDLCDKENFPNLEDDFHLVYKKNRLTSFTDQGNNTWIRKKIISEGGYGKVAEFKSHNPKFTDLAVKFFTSKGISPKFFLIISL